MACDLTQGFALDCRDSSGGLKSIRIAQLEHKDTLTAAAGVITAFTLTTGNQFWTYALDKEDADLIETENVSVENGSVFYETVVNFTIKKMQAATRNELRLLAQNRLMIIAEDNNGKYWLVGQENGADKVGGTNQSASGKLFGDLNGYTLGFTGKESDMMNEVDSSLIATLDAPAV